MKVDPREASVRDLYQAMVQLISPRPIAWVSTVSASGIANLAPFSFFNGVGANPPTIMFCPANQGDGSPKDTLANIQQVGQFAVNLVQHEHAHAMNRTAVNYLVDEDEFQMAAIDKAQCDQITPPRVANAVATFECELHTAMQLGVGPGGANLVIGNILGIHIRDDVLSADGKIDPDQLDLIGRLGGDNYIRTQSVSDGATDSVFQMPRPKR
jgi:flavin reductase (DIM6/NTAB) family NADH-FMN oxidoreductase RutF